MNGTKENWKKGRNSITQVLNSLITMKYIFILNKHSCLSILHDSLFNYVSSRVWSILITNNNLGTLQYIFY